MKLYTRFGDKGTTSLLGGANVPKNDPRVEAYGAVDELNAAIGVIIAFSEAPWLAEPLGAMQKDLFLIGAELATKGSKAKKARSIQPSRISEMEGEIDRLCSELPPLAHFIVPGGSKTASLLHLARTVCRRAERSIVALSRKEKVNPDIVIYMNRAGDLLFALARQANYKARITETVWKGR
jgi:cob(I)alamin adenosyltransferase